MPVVFPAIPIAFAVVALTLVTALPLAVAQEGVTRDDILSDAEWLEFKKARFNGQPILLHLKTGQARAVIWPEPIQLFDDDQVLPGCAVEINNDVVGFFPTEDFNRTTIKFRGLDSQIVYELRIRASEQGIEEPLQILR